MPILKRIYEHSRRIENKAIFRDGGLASVRPNIAMILLIKYIIRIMASEAKGKQLVFNDYQ